MLTTADTLAIQSRPTDPRLSIGLFPARGSYDNTIYPTNFPDFFVGKQFHISIVGDLFPGEKAKVY